MTPSRGDRRLGSSNRTGSWRPASDTWECYLQSLPRRRAPGRSLPVRPADERAAQAAGPRRARRRTPVAPPTEESVPSTAMQFPIRPCRECRSWRRSGLLRCAGLSAAGNRLESGREGSKAAISCPWHPKERSIDTPPHRISNRHKERGVGIETAQPIEETPRRGSPPIPRFLHRPPIAGWEPNHCVYPDEHRSAVRQLASKLQQRLQIPAGALLSPDAATQ